MEKACTMGCIGAEKPHVHLGEHRHLIVGLLGTTVGFMTLMTVILFGTCSYIKIFLKLSLA